MNLIDLLLTSLIISVFCCGFHLITEGWGWHKPFSEMEKQLARLRNTRELHPPEEGVLTYNYGADIIRLKTKLFFAKPFFYCCKCMASIWGATIFVILHGIPEHKLFIPDGIDLLIICCIMSAFLNAYFINKYYHS